MIIVTLNSVSNADHILLIRVWVTTFGFSFMLKDTEYEQKTPEEGVSVQLLKRCESNSKDKDADPKNKAYKNYLCLFRCHLSRFVSLELQYKILIVSL